MIFSWRNPWRIWARLIRVSPNGCTDNGFMIFRDRFFHNTIVTSADIFSANRHYPNVPACFISSKGNDISSPFLPKWNYAVATSILYVCRSRDCPFICTDWRSFTWPVGLKNKYIYGQFHISFEKYAIMLLKSIINNSSNCCTSEGIFQTVTPMRYSCIII